MSAREAAVDSFFRRFPTVFPANEPWLVLGKGPSLEKRTELDLTGFRKISLNHAVREEKVDIAHIIDIDVVVDLGEQLESQASWVVMPWHPHSKNRPSNSSLLDYCSSIPILAKLKSAGRLWWYNASTSPKVHQGEPVVPVRFFSSEAAVALLAMAGITKIRTLGVDGGAKYSTDFADLSGRTLLANGRSSFDVQFGPIASIREQFQLDLGPLDQQLPVKVFVGTTEEQMLCTLVLEHSIRRHSSVSVEVIPLHQVAREFPLPREARNQPRTPFSFHRFLIPELCQFKGKAIYVDSDMQVFRDIRELWSLPFDGADLLAVGDTRDVKRRPQFSVMLMNCETLNWRIEELIDRLDQGELDYSTLVYEMRAARRIDARIPSQWNALEQFYPDTALLHYTDMHRQPWVMRENRLAKIWCEELIRAVESGFISIDLIREHVARGWVRPSLLEQVAQKQSNPQRVSRESKTADRSFIAPYQKMFGITPPLPIWRRAVRRLRATIGQGG